jgi:hypothetical protein
MRQSRLIAGATFAFAMFALVAKAQTAPAQDTPSGPTAVRDLDALIADQFGFPKWFRIGGQYKGRLEDDTAISYVPNAADTYYLQRVRLNFAVMPTKWLRFVAEVQDAHNMFYGNRTFPSYYSDPFDLHQAYMEIGVPETTGFSVKAGRQELALGSMRLIGSGEWLNSGREHDAIRAAYTNVELGLKVELIKANLVLVDPTRFNRDIPHEHWYAAYGTAKKWIPRASVEPYYMLKTTWNTKGELGKLGDTYVSTLGGRVKGTTPGRFDYEVEVAKQIGHYATDPISALAGAYILGWKPTDLPWKPRFSAEYDHASGDHHNKDGDRQTFDNMYCGHGYMGFADQLGWKNVRSARAGFDFSAAKKLQLRFDALNDFLDTVQDSLYNIGGVAKFTNRNATSSHVGEEADITLNFQATRNMKFQAGFSHIFPGLYLKQTTKGSSYSAPYVMWTKNF